MTGNNEARLESGAGRVFVIVPVFNRWSFTQSCIDLLRRQTYPSVEIVLADGGSTDGTRERLAKDPGVVLLVSQEPEWWAGSAARGVAYAMDRGGPDDFVLLLNNDTVIPDDFVSVLVAASRTNAAAVGAKMADVKDPPTTLEAGVTIDWLSYRFNVKTEIGEGEHFFDGVDVLPGRGTLIPLHMIRAVGNIDAKTFPHYLADYDLTARIKKAGYGIGVSYDTVVLAYLDETGLPAAVSDASVLSLWRSLFLRKSMGNLFDHFRFVSRHSPPEFRFHVRWRILRYTLARLILASSARKYFLPRLSASAAASEKSRSSRILY